jgi:hypothetical protein
LPIFDQGCHATGENGRSLERKTTMPSVVGFAQLPDEEPAFLAYLQKTGDVWARAINDDPHNPKYAPLPVAEFLDRFADQIVAYNVVAVYLAFREDITRPRVLSHEITEGGSLAPFVQFGKVVEGVHTIVGGTKVMRESIHPMGSPFVMYRRGQFRREDELAISNLCFYPGAYEGQIWKPNPPAFMKWGKKVLDWMRRRTPESIPVYGCNYETRATVGVAAACKQGLKVS